MAPTKDTTRSQRIPLSANLPPLIFGTATFNHQYNKDPFSLNTTYLVHRALSLGVRAFDTSPYYGPAEELLGNALATAFVTDNFPRKDYFLLTKVGRISGDSFDYSPAWVEHSITRSLRRLNTQYLDVVYCHDTEFVSQEEVLAAVQELRRIRDEKGTIEYVGISGYPLPALTSLAEYILEVTGEPVDAVQSYANFTLQNTALSTLALPSFKRSKVDVVTNASPLGMGLLRRSGVPVGAMGDFHPAPPKLRQAVADASDFCSLHDERIEVVALRYSLETWLSSGSSMGSHGDPASGVPWTCVHHNIHDDPLDPSKKLGVSVIGVSNEAELDKTMRIWRSILDGLENGKETALKAGRWRRDHEWSINRRTAVKLMAEGVKEILDESQMYDFAWESPDPGFVNTRTVGQRIADIKNIKETERAVEVVGDENTAPVIGNTIAA